MAPTVAFRRGDRVIVGATLTMGVLLRIWILRSRLGPVDVLCSHMPPALDDLRFDLVAGRPEPGSQALVDYVEEHQPDYLYFGHVHQPRRDRLKVGRTWLHRDCWLDHRRQEREPA